MRLHTRYNAASVLGSPRVLLVFPLGLAAFALILQLTNHHIPQDPGISELFNEREFIRRADSIPRLEQNLRKSGTSGVSLKDGTYPCPKLPFPQGLGENWTWPEAGEAGPKIGFITTTAERLDQIRLWMAYHRALGVSVFYIFTEGHANQPENIMALRAEPGVIVIPNDDALKDRHAHSRVWNETWLSAFFNKPCNHELFVRQSLNMELGIELASVDGVEWLLHIDTDELMYPGGTRSFSLQELLSSVPQSVDLLIFPNYESLPERTDVSEPFEEVTLFKRNYAHTESSAYFAAYNTVARGNPNYFITYGNGKSAARLVPGLRPNGAHRWHNYDREPKEWSSEQGAVLHYTYNRFSDIKSRRDRCDCQPTEEDSQRCFILPFDRIAFLEASLKTDRELMAFFKQRLVWEDPSVVVDLLKKGVFTRLYEPQLLIRGLKEALTRNNLRQAYAEKGTSTGSKVGQQQQEHLRPASQLGRDETKSVSAAAKAAGVTGDAASLAAGSSRNPPIQNGLFKEHSPRVNARARAGAGQHHRMYVNRAHNNEASTSLKNETRTQAETGSSTRLEEDRRMRQRTLVNTPPQTLASFRATGTNMNGLSEDGSDLGSAARSSYSRGAQDRALPHA